ncbi:MAG: hypothetical protein V4719_03240 [Planctomycetota bacterium]
MPKPKSQPPRLEPTPDKCLWDDEPVDTRGLCSACYRALARKAGGDPAKWQEFEQQKLCLPKKNKRRCGVLNRLAELESKTN